MGRTEQSVISYDSSSWRNGRSSTLLDRGDTRPVTRLVDVRDPGRRYETGDVTGWTGLAPLPSVSVRASRLRRLGGRWVAGHSLALLAIYSRVFLYSTRNKTRRGDIANVGSRHVPYRESLVSRGGGSLTDSRLREASASVPWEAIHLRADVRLLPLALFLSSRPVDLSLLCCPVNLKTPCSFSLSLTHTHAHTER